MQMMARPRRRLRTLRVPHGRFPLSTPERPPIRPLMVGMVLLGGLLLAPGTPAHPAPPDPSALSTPTPVAPVAHAVAYHPSAPAARAVHVAQARHSPVAGRAAAEAPTPDADRTGVHVPILMYHYVRANPNAHDAYGADLSVPAAQFTAQLAFLAEHGFHTIRLPDLAGAVSHGLPLPLHPVILTFDDGYEDFYTAAYPALARFGFQATSFVITGRVGTPGYLTWAQMREMQASGLVAFEAHTVNHLELAHIPLVQAQYELVTSKAALEAGLGTRVDYFCYPSGDYNLAVEHLVRADGYAAAVTTHPGVSHHAGDLFALSRVRIHGADTPARFAAHLGLAPLPSRTPVLPQLPRPPPLLDPPVQPAGP